MCPLCLALLPAIGAVSDRKPGQDHVGGKVVPGDIAMGKKPPKAVAITRSASDGTGDEKPGHVIASGAATGPILAGSIMAELVEFRRIYAEEPDAVAGKAEAVAIAGARPARNELGCLFEKARGDGNDSENYEHRECAGETANTPASTKTERQGFTPC
ncbi:hypothetical protein GCM10010862_23940 [Devosia nitrariae]|uniref:Uncharacterized protein n=1 Tax=Devosia nitrariae TaxID=2071872 RepID=A0ABQ5W6A4_9HYPH|nr:hypothetical protein GCM10010862_23940 [Devosia nitrariae]